MLLAFIIGAIFWIWFFGWTYPKNAKQTRQKWQVKCIETGTIKRFQTRKESEKYLADLYGWAKSQGIKVKYSYRHNSGKNGLVYNGTLAYTLTRSHT